VDDVTGASIVDMEGAATYAEGRYDGGAVVCVVVEYGDVVGTAMAASDEDVEGKDTRCLFAAGASECIIVWCDMSDDSSAYRHRSVCIPL